MEKTEFSLTAPKRKKRIRVSANCPFPILIESWCGYLPNIWQWHIAVGRLQGGCVLVSNPQDMDNIYYSGYFGKGNLSTRGLEYSRMQEEFRNRKSRVSKNSVCLKVMSRRRYLAHHSWASRQSKSSVVRETGNKCETLPYPKRCHLASMGNVSTLSDIRHKDEVAQDSAADPVLRAKISRLETDEHLSSLCDAAADTVDSSFQASDEDFSVTAGTKEDITDSVETSKDSSAQVVCKEMAADPWDNDTEESTAFWSEETHAIDFYDVRHSENKTNSGDSSQSLILPSSSNMPDASQPCVSSTFVNPSDNSCISRPINDSESDIGKILASPLTSNNCPTQSVMSSTHVSDSRTLLSTDTAKVNNDNEAANTSSSKSCADTVMTSCYVANRMQMATGDKEKVEQDLDECCASDDEDADIYVVDDSSDSEMDENVVMNRAKWKNVAKEDPFPMKEQLQLGLEEAFFLSYGLGCLVVKEMDQPLRLISLWQRFVQLNPDFIPRYVVYHNLRSKGWVPRSGIKYGADFVVYKQGPPFYHSTYLVFVRVVNEGDLVPTSEAELSWTELACLNRVTEQVSKEVMFCYVIRSKDLSADEQLSSPKCLQKFKVSEVVIRRWISKKERDNSEYLQLP